MLSNERPLSRVLRAAQRLCLRRMSLASALGVLVGCLALAGCASTSGGENTSPTATLAPTATATCAQVSGFAGATSLTLPNMELPAGAIAPAPAISFGGTGQYTLKTYSVCAPNNTRDLIVSTGKGPEPLTQLLSFYGWTMWETYPTAGDAQQPCPDTCFAFNLMDPTKELFSGAPRFLSLESVEPLDNHLVLFTLVLAQAPDPICPSMFTTSDMAVYGHAPVYALYFVIGGVGAGIQKQWPPMTRLVGDSTPSTVGQDLCSAGTGATVKAFMDNQFMALSNFPHVPCTLNGNDCWGNAGETVTMNINSASDWMLSMPQPQMPQG